MTTTWATRVLPPRVNKHLRRMGEHARLRRRVAAGAQVPLDHVVIAVGAQKCGTIWLSWTLDQHPDIHIRRKEVHYWDRVRYPYSYSGPTEALFKAAAKQADLPFGRHAYDNSRYLPALNYGRMSERIVADITPAYALCTRASFAEMKAIHDDVRFVFLMRDPVERLWSGI